MNSWKLLVIVAILLSIGLIVLSAAVAENVLVPRTLSQRWLAHGRWQLAGEQDRTTLENLGLQFASLLSQFLLACLVSFIAPRRVRNVANAMAGGAGSILRLFALGFSVVVVLAAIALLSALSVYTFPLPFILMALLFLAALCGTVALTLQLGMGLLRRAGWLGANPLAPLALGSLILFSLSQAPYVGLAVLAVASLIGTGAAAVTRFGGMQSWSLAPLMQDPETR